MRHAERAAERTPLYSSGDGSPLKVALVTPRVVPGWLVQFAALAARSRAVELAVLTTSGTFDAGRQSVAFDVRMFLWLERMLVGSALKLAGKDSQGPLSPVRLDRVGDGCALTRCEGAEDVITGLGRLSPDLIVSCVGADESLRFATLAKHGCWQVRGDLLDPATAGVALLQPMLDEASTTAFGLELVPAGREASVMELGTSFGATKASSFLQQRDLAFRKLPSLLLRALRGVRSGTTSSPPGACELRLSPPAPSLGAGSGFRAFYTGVKQALGWRHRRHMAQLPWFLILPDSSPTIDPLRPRLEAFHCLAAPQGDYWADPYPVVEQGRRLIFAEEYVGATGKGIIICLELSDDGRCTRLGVVLDEPGHLSYPQVFRWNDAWYMTVESCEAGRVSLYRAHDFPLGWERVYDLVVGRDCVDPTLHHHEGRWYLFANVSESGGSLSEELYLFVADDLHGPYLPHPENPVLSDVRSSRPAGRLFEHAGRLIRPAQCCTPVYGAALVFNEVLELTPQRYRERRVSTMPPDMLPGLDGCHTYNGRDTFEVLDAHGRLPGPGLQRAARVDAT